MRMSEKGRELLTEWEGKERHVYRDAAGLMTIGVGHLLTRDELTSGRIMIMGCPVKYADGLTDYQIDKLLEQDLAGPEYAVNSGIDVQLNQNQFDAICSFVFNVGKQAFFSSTLRELLNQGSYNDVEKQLVRWNKAGGKVIPGLICRRDKEIALFKSEDIDNV